MPGQSVTAGPPQGVGILKHPLQQAEFAQSVADDSQLPPPGPPEIAFAGRSNAGKSSAINALANRSRLAFTSKTPGRTQQINFFRLRSGALLADLPGYGYAAVPLALKRHWQDFLGRYVATRQALIGLVLIVDARHGLAVSDRDLLAGFLPSGRPCSFLRARWTSSEPRAQVRALQEIEAVDRCRVSAACGASHGDCVLGAASARPRCRRSSPCRMARPRSRHGGIAESRRTRAQRKGPAIKGSAAGPETPVAGLIAARAPAQGGKRETLPSAKIDQMLRRVPKIVLTE